ncbi:hypothetical protein B0J17DRAFT_707696 [Rhizoctonia solani]|nr:hypothetical protein B0J17DRAFT_707696 [Rhizoctonia solani]
MTEIASPVTSTTTTPSTMAPRRHTHTRASASLLSTEFTSNPRSTPPSTQYLNPAVQPNSLFNLVMFRHLNTVFDDHLGLLFKTLNQAHLEEFMSYLLDAIGVIDCLAASNNISIAHQCSKSCIYSTSAPNKAFRDAEVMVRPLTPTPIPISRSYAEVACSASLVSTDKPSAAPPRSQPPKIVHHGLRHTSPHTRTHSSKPTTSPRKSMRKPVRMVIDFRGSPPAGYFDTPLAFGFRQLNDSSHARRTIPRPLGLHRNKWGNLLASFPDDTPLDKLRPCLDDITQCLGVPKTFKAYLDVPWASQLRPHRFPLAMSMH